MGHTGTRTTSGNPKRKARPGTSQSAGYPTHGLIFLSQVWLVARFVRVIPCAGATRSGKCLSLKCAGCTSALPLGRFVQFRQAASSAQKVKCHAQYWKYPMALSFMK